MVEVPLWLILLLGVPGALVVLLVIIVAIGVIVGSIRYKE
jgi:hypothetical protein